MAGMLEHCDFTEQLSMQTEDGLLRPDLTIHLPGNKNMVVDSKMPFEAFLKAIETTNDEEARVMYLKDHARQVRERLSDLSNKNYWKQFSNSPEFVILFLPTESLFSAALEHDPELIQMGWQRRVLMATPTTLIALLRAVAYGWNSEALSRNATAISELGKELYVRVSRFADHFIQLRKSIENTVKTYNDTAGSLESRVLITARKFNDLSVGNEQEIKIVESIEITPRAMPVSEANQIY
jgi:DNA recombination protein RmuC